jgi:hypothetical protein
MASCAVMNKPVQRKVCSSIAATIPMSGILATLSDSRKIKLAAQNKMMTRLMTVPLLNAIDRFCILKFLILKIQFITACHSGRRPLKS